MKQCRNCKLDIHQDARLCPHCHGYQSWAANQQDPRILIIVFGFMAAVMIPAFLLIPRLSPSSTRAEPTPTLTVRDHSFRLVSAPDGTHVFVLGHVANTSAIDATLVWFRVTLLGESGALLDESLVQSSGLLVPVGASQSFRLSFFAAPSPAEVKTVQVSVARSKAPSRWD